MKFLVVALAIFAVCSAALTDEDWARFQAKYKKAYRSADEAVNRRAVWESNWQKILKHNEDYARGIKTYTLGENEFADMTLEEFQKEKLGFNPLNAPKYTEEHVDFGLKLRERVDLREARYITPVRDQARCGGCWAFATVAAVEALYAKETGVNPASVDFSEQQIIDCSKGLLLGIIARNKGCDGGQIDCTFADMAVSGNQLASSYPYTSGTTGLTGTCKYDKTKVVYKIKGGKSLGTNEAGTIDAINAGYTVAIGIHANPLQLYKSGIFVGNATENSAAPNHAVLVSGYDFTHPTKHYSIKNSWNSNWGESGFFRLAYGGKHLNFQMAGYPY